MSIRVNSFENLTGRQFGTVVIGQRARLRPLGWHARCVRCKTQFVLPHERARYGECPVFACRAAAENERIAQARAADREAARPPLDPDGLRRAMDWRDRK